MIGDDMDAETERRMTANLLGHTAAKPVAVEIRRRRIPSSSARPHIEVVREWEEFGKEHVFVFRCILGDLSHEVDRVYDRPASDELVRKFEALTFRVVRIEG